MTKLGDLRGINEAVVAVAIVGRPCSRVLDDGWTAEVTRLCALPETRNACSMLYAAYWRAARALGYRKLVTYTPVVPCAIAPQSSATATTYELGWTSSSNGSARSTSYAQSQPGLRLDD